MVRDFSLLGEYAADVFRVSVNSTRAVRRLGVAVRTVWTHDGAW